MYTRSTPMMEAVKIGRLDLIESLIQAGGRLDVQVERLVVDNASSVKARSIFAANASYTCARYLSLIFIW